MVDVREDVLRPLHGTTPAAVKSNIKQKWDPLRAMKTFIRKKSDFVYQIFHVFIHVYSPGTGADNPLGTKFDVSRKSLSLCPFVASFKKISLQSVHVYSPRAGAHNPLKAKFWCQQKGLTTFAPFIASVKKSLWSLILYIFFIDFIHAYSPISGADNPLGTKFWCQQIGLITLPICWKFKKSLWCLILHQFFHAFIHIYIPRAGADKPLGT